MVVFGGPLFLRRLFDVGGGVPSGYCAGVAGSEGGNHMGDGRFCGGSLGELVVQFGVFGDAAADGLVMLGERGFVCIADGGYVVHREISF